MKFPENLKKFINENKLKVIIVLFVLGFLLVSFSGGAKKENETQTDSGNLTVNEYISETEEKLSKTISSMLSGKKVNVMITVENGIEYVYATENKSDNDVATDESSGTNTKTQQRGSNENTYRTVKDDDGNEKPLIVSEIMPNINGVFIVCDGGENESVKSAVISAVQTVLNINSENIYVSGKF